MYLRSFGCQMNDYDSNRIADLMAGHGYELVPTPQEADLAVIVTCSIREKAQEKTFSDLGRLRLLKQERPGMLIAVGGCVASQEGREILRRSPWVDVVFGPQTLHRLPALIERRLASGKGQVDIGFPEIEKFAALPPPAARNYPTAFVSVMEGCSKYCTYCVVPYTRGSEISRPLVDVLVECVRQADQGVREITLLGQNVNAYRGRDASGGLVDFAALLQYVSEVEGIERIRYMTSHPTEFSDRLIEAYAHLPKLASHVHLPVQSGSDRILAAMKRGYTHDWYLERIAGLRKARPGISVATDFIVGFPGETEEDFAELADFLTRARLDAVGVFGYSDEEGTEAAGFDGKLDQDTVDARVAEISALADELTDQRAEDRIGSEVRVLVERGPEHEDGCAGRAELQGPEVDGECLVADPGPVGVGEVLTCRVIGTEGVDLLVRPVDGRSEQLRTEEHP